MDHMTRRLTRPLLGTCVLAAAVLSAATARAQQETVAPEKAAAIRQLLELTRASELMVTSIETTLSAQKAASPQVPEEFWEAFTARLRSEVDRFVELLIPLYAEHFTLEQVQQLIEFYQTPLGRHLVTVQPQLARESMLAGQQWGAQLGMEVAAELEKRGIRIP